MSLDITIKQDKKKIYTNNFYGFIHFNDSKNRHKLASDMKPERVVNYATYKKFIENSVESDKQKMYLDLVNKSKPINIFIS